MLQHLRGSMGTKPPEPDEVEPVETADREKPIKIGLALGGGAARGWAHIGVLQALEERGIVPHVIAGTSIGAVVGGCHLAGKLDRLELFARSLSRRRILGLLDLNFGGSSLIGGDRLVKLLSADLADMRIEDLKRQFIAVTTEVGTGHEIWHSEGNLVNAIRASFSLPGIFKPTQLNNRWQIDGALVNPIPVSVCRAFGARMVIAVNLSANVFGRGTVIHDHGLLEDETAIEEIPEALSAPARAKRLLMRQLMGRKDGPPGISAIMVDAFNIIQDRISRSRLAGDPPDVLISPRVGDVGLFEFHRADETIKLGRDAVHAAIDSLDDAFVRLA
ncbi:MAG: patatin-like phospholipase family protein [Pseudomonadota bacterium]